MAWDERIDCCTHRLAMGAAVSYPGGRIVF